MVRDERTARFSKISEAKPISFRLIPHAFKNVFRPVFPRSAVSISADYVASIRVSTRPPHPVENCAYTPLPAGVVVPSHAKPNISDPEGLHRALKQAIQHTGLFHKEVNLLIPDVSARVFLVSLESLPGKRNELVELLRFKVKKSLPFSIDEAVLSFQVQTLAPSRFEVILTVINQAILREYENAMEAVGLEPGFVTVEHFGIAHLLDLQARDWQSRSTLLFRLAPRFFTTSIYHQGFLRFYRSMEKDYSSLQPPPANPEMLFDEIYPSLVYYQDKFQKRIEMIYVSGLPAGSEGFWAAIQKLAECPVTEIRADRAMGAVPGKLNANEMNQMLAPLIGVELGIA